MKMEDSRSRIDGPALSATAADRMDNQRMRQSSGRAILAIAMVIGLYLVVLYAGLIPGQDRDHGAGVATAVGALAVQPHELTPYTPPLAAVAPFVALLLSIAVLPLIPATQKWWHHNRSRFLVASALGAVTLAFYGMYHPGGIDNHFTHAENSGAGMETVWAAFCNAFFSEFIPFIVLLFSLYVISGGISLSGDLPAHPKINLAFLAMGTVLASFIGTTGAAMLLIRPLLNTNHERKYRTHTVIFFIFTVCNCGGLLLPIGDPPLFLGYLRGVPFTWTLDLWPYWLGVNLSLLFIYFIWDSIAYRKEEPSALALDERTVQPLRLSGRVNFLFLLGVVLCVALVVPDKPFLGSAVTTPVFLREAFMLALVVVSLLATRPSVRVKNRFDYMAITEVAALFSGIFICMQAPIEILHVKGPSLGIDSPLKFFWTTGILSSFLDNAPTYVVFFETAISLPVLAGATQVLVTGGRAIVEPYLIPISLGAVFMGANTYIGNGPNFMVKSIAEQAGVKMPSFFGYMGYSIGLLIPLFLALGFLL